MRSAEFEKVAELLGRQHKIKVREGDGWAANIKNREVFYKKKDVYTLPENHILGLLLHEIAHIHYTTDTPQPNVNKELFHSTMNMLEDLAIEHIISFDYPNAGEILSETKEEVLDTLVRILPTLETSQHEKCLLYASARFEGRGYKHPMTQYEIVGDEIAEIISKNKDKILNRKKTKDIAPIANEIIAILLAKVGKPSEHDRQSLAAASQEGNAQNGTPGKKATNAVIKKLGGLNKGGQDIWTGAQNVTFVDKIADQALMLGKRMRSILKRNNAMEFGGRFRTGKLRTKNIIRTRTVKDRRPFGRRIVKSNKSYAFAVATDVSGSMFNSGYASDGSDNASRAMSSLYMVREALRVAGIPRSLIMFGVRAVSIKDVSSSAIRWNEISNETKMRRASQSDTSITDAIRLGREQLENVRSERKIIIVLTDGGDNDYEVRQEVEKARKAGIECIGITLGFGSCLSNCLPKGNNVNIEDENDHLAISSAFIKILNNTVTRSK